MRDIMANVGYQIKAHFAAGLKQIWVQPNRESALKLVELFIKKYKEQYHEVIETLKQSMRSHYSSLASMTSL